MPSAMGHVSSGPLVSRQPQGVTCQQIAAALPGYLDGTLPRREDEAFHDHFLRCSDCLALLNTYQATVRAIRAARTVDERTEVWQDRLLQRVHATRGRASCMS